MSLPLNVGRNIVSSGLLGFSTDFTAVRLLLVPAAEFLIFKVQITSGAGPLKLCFSAFDTCLFQHLGCVQMALRLMALIFQFKIVVISLGNYPRAYCRTFAYLGKQPHLGLGLLAFTQFLKVCHHVVS